MFKFKTAAEISAMSEDDATKYHNELNAHLEATEKALKDAMEAKASKEDVSKLADELKQLVDAVKAQGIELAKRNEEQTEKTTFEQISKGLKDNLESLKALKGGQKLQFDFALKAVGTMTFANSVTGEVPQAQRLAGFNAVATRMPFISQLINSGVATSNVISWVEEVTGEGDAAMTAEGAAKSQLDADFKIGSENIRKVTVYIKVSEEMLEDVDFMASYINNKLLQRINLKIDSEILTGDGTGQELNGIITQATAYAAGSFAAAVDEANNFDVLKTAINQVMVNLFNPNYIVMHPSDVTAMALTKDTTGQYVFPTFQMPGGKEVAGIPVITNTGMTVDKFLVMDSTKATVYYKNNVRIEAGWENDDFTKNLRTILAEARLALVIEGNDTGAFVYGDFSDAKAALETV